MRRPAPPEGQVVACPRARQRRGVRQPFRLRGAPERRFGATAAGALRSPLHDKTGRTFLTAKTKRPPPSRRIDDIIASKAATNRQKDRESLPRLRAFREYWIAQHQKP